MTFTGALLDINAALNGMTFNPTLNYNGPSTLTITSNDLGNAGYGRGADDGQQRRHHGFAGQWRHCHDRPAQVTDEDTDLVFSSGAGNGISVADLDVNEGTGQVPHITLTAAHGTLTLSGLTGLSFTVGDGTGDATMTFTGTLVDVNAALNGLTFSPSQDYNGAAAGIQATINDLGNTGSGSATQRHQVGRHSRRRCQRCPDHHPPRAGNRPTRDTDRSSPPATATR